MRRHENIGYSAFNTYRSGDENSRQYDYGNPEGHSRGGRSVYGQSSRDNDAADRLYSTSSGYGSASSQSSYSNPSGSSSHYGQQSRNQGPSSQSWMNQGSSQPRSSSSSEYSPSNSYESGRSSGYGSPSRGSSDYGRRDSDRSNSWSDRAGNRMENWADRTGDRMENWADRAGNQVERWGDRISNAWDRTTDDDDRNRRSRGWSNQGPGMSGHHPNYSHGNASQNRYTEDYDHPAGSSSYGSRYEPRSGGNFGRYEENRGSHRDEGFFDHLGNRISNAWDRWIGNDEDEQRRYENRSHYRSSGRSSDRDNYNW